jgi:hypothetical protein
MLKSCAAKAKAVRLICENSVPTVNEINNGVRTLGGKHAKACVRVNFVRRKTRLSIAGMTTGEGEKFDFLGYGFQPRRSKNRFDKYFSNFSPAISDKAGKSIREEIRSWNLHLRSEKAIEDLSRMFNPKIRCWLQYYGRYHRSALYPYMRQLDRSLAQWAYRKYKKLRGHLRRATHWIARISRRDSTLFPSRRNRPFT